MHIVRGISRFDVIVSAIKNMESETNKVGRAELVLFRIALAVEYFSCVWGSSGGFREWNKNLDTTASGIEISCTRTPFVIIR